MLSTDRRSSDEEDTAYRTISRVKQACTVCRLKKIRCSGKRPRCDTCVKTQQVCDYPEVQRIPKFSHDGCAVQCNSSIVADLRARYSLIESRLNSIEGLLRSLVKQGDSPNPLEPSTLDGPHIDPEDDPIEPAATRCLKRKRTASDGNSCSPRSPSRVSFAGMLPMTVLLDTIDVYFNDWCPQQPYSFFHEGDFRQRLSHGQVDDHLLFSVLANGLRYSTHQFFDGRAQELGETYADRAWKLVVAEYFTGGRKPDVIAVQTVALLSIFDFTAGKNRHATAWLKIGIAIRIAQDLNMMEDPSNEIPPLEAEQQRRVFWSLYILDRLVSCGQHRPPMILDGSCHLQLPANESDYEAGVELRTPTLEQVFSLTSEQQGSLGYFAAEVIMARTLARTAQYMLQQIDIGCSGPPWNANSGYATLQSELLHLESLLLLRKPLSQLFSAEPGADASASVPKKLSHPMLFPRSIFHLCYCLLNHPFLLRRRFQQYSAAPPSFQSRAFDEGFSHAKQQIALHRQCRSVGHHVQNSFDSYCIMVAGSILGLHSRGTNDEAKQESRRFVLESIELLSDLGRRWANVSLMCQELKRFADNAQSFESLASDASQSPTLSSDEESTMWLLVDYSTVSSADVSSLLVSGLDETFWQNLDTVWNDLAVENMPFDIATAWEQLDPAHGDSRI